MKSRPLLLSLLAIALSVATAVAAERPEAPSDLSTNGPEPKQGVYLGAGCAGAERLKQYEAWLGRDVDQVLEFIGWDVLEAGTTWALNCWQKAGEKSVVYSMPMLPPDRSATLAQGAGGKFDQLFRRYGELLVKHGYGDSIIRIGWEFNAEWYSWAASKDPQSWVAYWRRIVSILRDVPGASFKFDWCPSAGPGGFHAERAYPGDDVVDIIGLDFYNMPIDAKSFSPEQRWQARMNMLHGLKWHRDFAARHGKPMSFPEWGTGIHAQHGGPADDPYFIEQMAAWIAGNEIVYHDYWDYRNKEYDSKLSNGKQPAAGKAFLGHFGSAR